MAGWDGLWQASGFNQEEKECEDLCWLQISFCKQLTLLPPFVGSSSILKQQLLLAPQAYHYSPKSSSPSRWHRSWSKSPVEADCSLGGSRALSRGLSMHLGTQGASTKRGTAPHCVERREQHRRPPRPLYIRRDWFGLLVCCFHRSRA